MIQKERQGLVFPANVAQYLWVETELLGLDSIFNSTQIL